MSSAISITQRRIFLIFFVEMIVNSSAFTLCSRYSHISTKTPRYGAYVPFLHRVKTSITATIDITSSNATSTDKSTDGSSNNNKKKSTRNRLRFRQHVNPLARRHQKPVELDPNWVSEAFIDPTLPLLLDIGCAKGGFLLDMASSSSPINERQRNYLGLEIRPDVAKYAQSRVEPSNLDGRLYFIGCNVNVDLDRILTDYSRASTDGILDKVCIQFPDPHFKKSHLKRRVVKDALVRTLAQHISETGEIFLQSDIQEVLNDMRSTFRSSVYFQDFVEDENEYMDYNPWGVPTEREVSVLKKDLSVFRTLLRRTNVEYNEKDN